MFKKEIVIDAKGHLLGRLASVVAKELLCGQKVTIVRCEEINISGSLFRNKLKYDEFRRKRTNANPKKGPFHQRSPSKILQRVIRGMVPHKKARGAAALDRLKVFEGVPYTQALQKRMVVPQALKVLRLKPTRKFCKLGDLSQRVGWKCQDLIKKLEDKRKSRDSVRHTIRKEKIHVRSQVAKKVDEVLNA